ncbi:hypothetical protein Tco_1352908 [Tanacetum coccineum]
MEQENQQQIHLDEALVSKDDQVKIKACNFRIALEKKQKEPTYQLTLDIFKQYSCYNAFLKTADLDNQQFEVGVELLHEVLQITLKVPNQEFVEPPPHDKLVSFAKQLGYTCSLELVSEMFIDHMYQPWRTFLSIINRCLSGKSSELIWKDFQFQIDSRHTNAKKRELMPYPRFTKLIINHFLSKHDTLSKRHNSFINIIKYDLVLGKLKFVNKGEEHQKYGISIPDSMINDAIRISAHYLTYLALSTNTVVNVPKLGTDRGKSLMGNKNVDDDVHKEKKQDDVSRKKRSFTAADNILPDPDEVLKLAKSISLTEVEQQDEERCLYETLETDKGVDDNQKKKLKGVSNTSDWGSKDEVEVISSEDERTETDGSKKARNEKAGDEKAEEDKVEHEKAREEEVGEEQAGDEQTGLIILELQQEKPVVPTSNTSNTLSSVDYGNQFLNDNADLSLNEVLKDPVEAEVQSMVDVPIHEANPDVQRTPLVDTVVTILPEKTTPSPKQQPSQSQQRQK